MQKLSFQSFSHLNPVWNKEDSQKIIDLLKTKHAVYLVNEIFELETGYNKDLIQIKISLKKEDESVVYPIEIICVHDNETQLKVQETTQIIVDYIDLYWSEFFQEERNLFVPLDWSSYHCEGVNFFLRGFIRNLTLEKHADLLLKEYGLGEHEIFPISSET